MESAEQGDGSKPVSAMSVIRSTGSQCGTVWTGSSADRVLSIMALAVSTAEGSQSRTMRSVVSCTCCLRGGLTGTATTCA